MDYSDYHCKILFGEEDTPFQIEHLNMLCLLRLPPLPLLLLFPFSDMDKFWHLVGTLGPRAGLTLPSNELTKS